MYEILFTVVSILLFMHNFLSLFATHVMQRATQCWQQKQFIAFFPTDLFLDCLLAAEYLRTYYCKYRKATATQSLVLGVGTLQTTWWGLPWSAVIGNLVAQPEIKFSVNQNLLFRIRISGFTWLVIITFCISFSWARTNAVKY